MNPKIGLDGCAAQSVARPGACAAGSSAQANACLPRENGTLLSPALEDSISFRHEDCFEHAQLRG